MLYWKNPEIIKRVSEELGLPEDLVRRTYDSYWKFIRESIQSLPLKEDPSEEDFNKLRVNFNIPSLGKLTVAYQRYTGIKNQFNKFKDVFNKKN